MQNEQNASNETKENNWMAPRLLLGCYMSPRRTILITVDLGFLLGNLIIELE